MMMEPQAKCRQHDLWALTDDRLQRLETINRKEITSLIKLLLGECVIGHMAKHEEADDE
jgi:hypothetical protein